MLIWLFENVGTIVVALLLSAFLTFLILKLFKDKKSGKSCCGHCDSCAMSNTCHAPKDDAQK